MTTKGTSTTLLTQQYVLSILDYDPISGLFRWRSRSGGGSKVTGWNTRYAGAVAGYPWKPSAKRTAYTVITVLDYPRYAHRLAFLSMVGSVPDEIDHMDRDGLNNSWSNLRDVTHVQNMQNITVRNPLGAHGVYATNGGRFYVQVSTGGRTRRIGTYDTLEVAIAVRRETEAVRSRELA